MQTQDFTKWFNSNMKLCKEAYYSIATKFRQHVYNILDQQGASYTQSQWINEQIDKAFMLRFGLSDDMPHFFSDDKTDTVQSVLENLIYGDKIPKNIMRAFVEQCEYRNVDKMFIKQLKKQCVENMNKKYVYL